MKKFNLLKDFLENSTLSNKPEIKNISIKNWDTDDGYIVEVSFDRSTSEDEILKLLDEIWTEIFDFLEIPVYVKYKLV